MSTVSSTIRPEQDRLTTYTCISADSHIDLVWLPPDLFTANAARAMKDRMPFVTDSPDGPLWVTKRGVRLGLVGGVGSSGRKYVPGRIIRSDRMAAEGVYNDASRISRRMTDPHQRVKDQDRDGIQAEVIYGILGSLRHVNDPEATWEMCRIYNDWLAGFCSVYPDRLLGLALIPGNDIAAALKEYDRVAALDLKGVALFVTRDSAPMYDPQWEPLWKALNEGGRLIHFHTPGGSGWPKPGANWSKKDLAAANAVYVTNNQISASATVLSAMILGGMLERYPSLQVIFGESGIGWIPYLLDRMDYEWEDQFRGDLDLKMKPSEYWRRQCKASFQYDEIGMRLLDVLGEDTLMWASDFPHPEGVWPDSQEYIQKQFHHLPQQVKQKLICSNAAALYGVGS